MVGRTILLSGSDSMARTRVHFSGIFGRPRFFVAQGSVTIPSLSGGSVASRSNSVNSSSLIVPIDPLSSNSVGYDILIEFGEDSLSIHLGESRFYRKYLFRFICEISLACYRFFFKSLINIPYTTIKTLSFTNMNNNSGQIPSGRR